MSPFEVVMDGGPTKLILEFAGLISLWLTRRN